MVRTRRRPAPNVVLGVVLAVAGLACLSGGVDGLGRGEVLTMGAALAFAVHIECGAGGGVGPSRPDPPQRSAAGVTMGAACLLPGAATEGGYGFDGGVWLAAAFCGVAATALAFWCMTWGRHRGAREPGRHHPAARAGVGQHALGELVGDHLGPTSLLGAALILAAVVVAGPHQPRPPAVGAELAVVPPDP